MTKNQGDERPLGIQQIYNNTMVLWSVDSNRVQELEQELEGIKKAFSEYIHSSQDFENGLDQELEDMRKKIWTDFFLYFYFSIFTNFFF